MSEASTSRMHDLVCTQVENVKHNNGQTEDSASCDRVKGIVFYLGES